jgi:membrane-associated phospholipid phosphatase
LLLVLDFVFIFNSPFSLFHSLGRSRMDANTTLLPAPLVARRALNLSPFVRLVLLAVFCVAAGLATLSIDMAASNWFRAHPAGDGVAKLLSISESFSHGAGVAVILLAAAVLDRGSRRRIPRVAAIAFGGGLLANGAKSCLARWRPISFAGESSVWETFGSWLPWLSSEETKWGSHLQSFPSAHAATGFGLAIGLSWLYPHGRWLFAGLAVFAALQRVDAGAHYPSDIWFGAAIGCLSGAAWLADDRITRFIAKWENGAAVAPRLEKRL